MVDSSAALERVLAGARIDSSQYTAQF